MASGALGLLPVGRGDGGEAADCVATASLIHRACEAFWLLPADSVGVHPLPNPSPIKGEGLESRCLRKGERG